MKTIVVDASVVLQFLLNENTRLVENFSEILREAKKKKLMLLSHTLLGLEVLNGLRFSLRDQNKAEEIGAIFLRLPIGIIVLSDAHIQKALSLSYVYGTTVYDASYHVLALARNATFLTADREYYKKAQHIGKIELLG